MRDPPGAGLTDEVLAGPVTLDRTAPAFGTLDAAVTGDMITLKGHARDAGLYVSRVDVGYDDRRLVSGCARRWAVDEADEAFTLQLEGLPPGDHILRVRITDALGNASIRTRTVRTGR